MKLGILGSGMIANTLLDIKEHLKGIDICAICCTERSREKALKTGIKSVFTDYTAMLATDIDTVYIAVPNHLHYEYAKTALLNGKHVIAEKPIASNFKETKELFKIADENKLFLFEAITTLHLPNFKEIKKSLSKIGDIKLVEFNYMQYSSRYDRFKEGDFAPVFCREKSGGALMDINLYNIYFVVGLFGKPTNALYFPEIEKDVDVSGTAILEYNGFKAICTGSKNCNSELVSTICGDSGYIAIKSVPNSCEKFSIIMNSGEKTEYNYNIYSHRMINEFIEFERCIREKDYCEYSRLAKIALDVSEVMTNARKYAGYLFPADEKGLD